MTRDEILEIIERERVAFISLQFTTIAGETKHLVLPARDLEGVLDGGCGFDGSSAGFVPVNQSDLVLQPDLRTFRILHWGQGENRTARFICDLFEADGTTPLPTDPRGFLKRVVREMQEEFGPPWDLFLAPELEFYLLVKDDKGQLLPHDQAGYFSTPPKDKGTEFRKRLSRALDSLGIVCQKNHHEVPKGKHEINFQFGPALDVADATVTYKQVVKYFAAEEGWVASFMPKPFFGTYGTGMHVHLSLGDTVRGENFFYGPGEEDDLSPLARQFMAGLLAHARGLAGVTNPSVNSYKRLVPGWEAPVYIAWGMWNRSALLRVPASSPKARRVEVRSPDASCNPYIAFGSLLAAGLDGIRRKLELSPPVNENIYAMEPEKRSARGIGNLPENLKEALDCLEQDEVLTNVLGEALLMKFLDIKRKEWQEFSVFVHPWELGKYVDV
jgi:glutamine synthetase